METINQLVDSGKSYQEAVALHSNDPWRDMHVDMWNGLWENIFAPNRFFEQSEVLYWNLRHNFELGLPFCQAQNLAYRQTMSSVDEHFKIHNQAIRKFQEDAFTFGFLLFTELLKYDGNVCKAAPSAVMITGWDTEKVNAWYMTYTQLLASFHDPRARFEINKKMFQQFYEDDMVKGEFYPEDVFYWGSTLSEYQEFFFFHDAESFHLGILNLMSRMGELINDVNHHGGVNFAVEFDYSSTDSHWVRDRCGAMMNDAQELAQKHHFRLRNWCPDHLDLSNAACIQFGELMHIAQDFQESNKILIRLISPKEEYLAETMNSDMDFLLQLYRLRFFRNAGKPIVHPHTEQFDMLSLKKMYSNYMSQRRHGDLTYDFAANWAEMDWTLNYFIDAATKWLQPFRHSEQVWNPQFIQLNEYIRDAKSFHQILSFDFGRKRREADDEPMEKDYSAQPFYNFFHLFGYPNCHGGHLKKISYSFERHWDEKAQHFIGWDSNGRISHDRQSVQHTGPYIEYLNNKFMHTCECDEGHFYFDGKCEPYDNYGCQAHFSDGVTRFLTKGEKKLSSDCTEWFYCDENSHLSKSDAKWCPEDYCSHDKESDVAECKWIGNDKCLHDGVQGVSVFLISDRWSGEMNFDIETMFKFFDHSDKMKWDVAMVDGHEKVQFVDAASFGVVKNVEYVDTRSSQVISLFAEIESRLMYSMAGKRHLAIALDESLWSPPHFDRPEWTSPHSVADVVSSAVNRLKKNGVIVDIFAFGHMTQQYNSLASGQDHVWRIEDDSVGSYVLPSWEFVWGICSYDECDYNNGRCSHKCSSDKYGQAKCSCPAGFKLKKDGKSCRVDEARCQITNEMNNHYQKWKQDVRKWKQYQKDELREDFETQKELKQMKNAQ
jgi:hypothetical protein